MHLGGARAQAHLRQSFQVMGCLLIPETATLPYAETGFVGETPKVCDLTRTMSLRLVEMSQRPFVNQT
jgi:hypothetical protein